SLFQLLTSSNLLARISLRSWKGLPLGFGNMNHCQLSASPTITATLEPKKLAKKTTPKCLFLQQQRMMTSNDGEDPPVGARPVPEITQEQRARIEERQRSAFAFFAETLQIYGVEELIFCFNGGKDCTVLLDLLMRYLRQEGISSGDIPMLYIKSEDSFPEIDTFVARCVRNYRVQLIEYEGSLKEALTHMQADMPRVRAVFVGSRNTDPYCQHLAPMQPTDNDWPPMMRLNPLLEWSYHDVWHYIHMHSVPYCSLYDRGFTSIGYRSNTVPNPHLKRIQCNCLCAANSDSDSSSVVTCICDDYRPAWELEDPTQERAGRLPRK
ncbi:hypothetical protein KR009_011708, partial [Drosophila setifemur]